MIDHLFLTIRITVMILTLLTGFVLSVKSIFSLFYSLRHTELDRIFANFFIILVYSQFLLEIVHTFGSAHSYEESFRIIEHVALITVATAFVQIGRMIIIKSNDNLVKFRFSTVFYGIATFLLTYSFLL